ncbi:hypothetical protein GBAR_LOCUS187, partial [Geodia barretti]
MSTLDSAVEIPQPELIVMIQDNDRVVVSFTETEYVVNESDLLLEVCVSLDGATEVPVSVMLALQPDDQLSPDMMATFGSDTDVLRDPEITFPPSVFPQEPICRTVTIINDTIFENDEIFLVSMSTLRDR